MAIGTVGQFPSVKRQGGILFDKGIDPRSKRDAWEQKMLTQLFNCNALFDQALVGEKGKPMVIKSSELESYAESARFVERQYEIIEGHIDRRIQLFFMQLISVYRTPYHFEWVEANDQYGGGGTYKLKTGSKEIDLKTQAAHSSTLPCLVAYPKEQWAEGKEKGGFVYLKYGHSYTQHNATIEMPIWVNQADTYLDGTHKRSRLRNDAIEIVNKVAQGLWTPRKGMQKFMTKMENWVEKSINKLSESDFRADILKAYLKRIQEVKLDMDDGYFDDLLGVKLTHHKEEVLRRVVYQRRYRLIQQCEAIESQIARDILDAQNAMLKKRSAKLSKVDYRLRYILLEDVNPQFRRMMERLFCTSLEQLQYGIERNEERLRAFERKSKIEAFRKKYQEAITNLKRTLRRRFRSMSSEELNYRAELFKGLRTQLKNWYQREFVEAFHERYPREPMSKSMVSRFEQRTRPDTTKVYKTPESQRRKDIEEEKAKRIAKTFEIDAGLFLPAIVSSVY